MQQPEAHSKSQSSQKILIVVAAVFLIVIMVLAFHVYNNSTPQQSKTDKTSQDTLVYKGAKVPKSFNYPASWEEVTKPNDFGFTNDSLVFTKAGEVEIAVVPVPDVKGISTGVSQLAATGDEDVIELGSFPSEHSAYAENK